MSKHKFKIIDKTIKKSVGLENWNDGLLSDPNFITVWSK